MSIHDTSNVANAARVRMSALCPTLGADRGIPTFSGTAVFADTTGYAAETARKGVLAWRPPA